MDSKGKNISIYLDAGTLHILDKMIKAEDNKIFNNFLEHYDNKSEFICNLIKKQYMEMLEDKRID